MYIIEVNGRLLEHIWCSVRFLLIQYDIGPGLQAWAGGIFGSIARALRDRLRRTVRRSSWVLCSDVFTTSPRILFEYLCVANRKCAVLRLLQARQHSEHQVQTSLHTEDGLVPRDHWAYRLVNTKVSTWQTSRHLGITTCYSTTLIHLLLSSPAESIRRLGCCCSGWSRSVAEEETKIVEGRADHHHSRDPQALIRQNLGGKRANSPSRIVGLSLQPLILKPSRSILHLCVSKIM